jgi:ATP-dependent DNA helicase RecG
MTSKLPINLENLLRQRQVEGERIEYKAGWNPDAILRTLCAFANDFENLGGGYVVIGQDCDVNGMPVFPPVGLEENQLDKIQQELLGFCNLMQPPYFPLLSVERFADRNLLVLWAPGGLSRPYKVPKSVTVKTKEYRYYLRRYSSTIEAKGEDERELISLTAQVPYDDRVNQNATTADLSPRLMEEFLREVGSGLANEVATLPVEALGRQMRVVAGPSEAPLPQNVGLLFFNEHPERFFPVTQIDVVWFPEGAGGDRFEEKIFQGPLGRITRDAISFIQRNYLKETIIKHPQRAEAERFWNFPQAAIEEAVVNAIYHRSYEIREPVEIRISREDLVVLSFPGPDRSIQLADLKKGKAVSRRYRNRRIGEFLKELELTEGRSTGISKIIKAMAQNGSPAPEFETDEDRSYFLIRLPVHEKADDGSGLMSETGSEKTAPGSEKSSEKTSGDTAGKIIELLQKSPTITAVELAMALGISSRAVEKQLAKIKDSGRIQRQGSDKGGRWVVLDARNEASFASEKGVAVGEKGSGVATQETTQETTQEKILGLLRANPATTRVALAKNLGLSADGVKYHLDKLRASGEIRHHGPTKAGHWEIIDLAP